MIEIYQKIVYNIYLVNIPRKDDINENHNR